MNEHKKPFINTSSEGLDQPLVVVSTKNWLALFAIALLATLAALWLIFGSIPVTVEGQAFYWQKEDEKVIYAALPVANAQKVGEKFLALMQMSDQKLKGEVTKNFMNPMSVKELKKNIPYPPLASFLMGKNKAVVLIKIRPLLHAGQEPLSLSTGEISIRIATIKPIEYVVPSS